MAYNIQDSVTRDQGSCLEKVTAGFLLLIIIIIIKLDQISPNIALLLAVHISQKHAISI